MFASDVLLVSPCISYLQIMTIMIDGGEDMEQFGGFFTNDFALNLI